MNPPLNSRDIDDDDYGGGDVPEGICPECDQPYEDCQCEDEEEEDE